MQSVKEIFVIILIPFNAEAYIGSCQMSMMELFWKIS